MIRYLVLSNIAIALHYILYKALLQNDTFFSLKRVYLLFSIVFSVLLPIAWLPELCIDAPDTLNGFSVLFLNTTKSPAQAQSASLYSSYNWLAIIYLICIGGFLIRFCIRLLSIVQIKKKAQKKELNGYSIYVVKEEISPFTFLNMIFINSTNIRDKHTLPLILKHESVHKIHWHSIDTILVEIVNMFFFFNPFTWLLKKELLLNLECIADNEVKKSRADLSAYQYAIVNTATKQKFFIVNQFNVSQLKKRIIMLNKRNSKKNELLKYLSVAPMLLVLLSINQLAIANSPITASELLNNIDKNENSAKPTSAVEWLNSDINLGEIPKGTPKTATYEFINLGNKPVIISNVKVSCGCTSKSYSKEPIQPGQKGEIKASYNAARSGKFNKTITVTLNDGSTPRTLKIRGVVVTK